MSWTVGPNVLNAVGSFSVPGKLKVTWHTFTLLPLISLDDGISILYFSEGMDGSDKYYLNTTERMTSHIKHFVDVHDEWVGNFIPTVEDVVWMSSNTMNSGKSHSCVFYMC